MQIDPPTLNDIDDIDGLPDTMGKRKSSLAKHSSIKSIKQKQSSIIKLQRTETE